MPTLYLHLNATPLHDLRSIASRLGVAGRAPKCKADYAHAIANAWADPLVRDRIRIALSPAARSALLHLLNVKRTPAALFFAEYGAIRPARTRERGESPWRNPATVAEELYYSALLAVADLKRLHNARYLCVPDDLDLDRDIWFPMRPTVGQTLENEPSEDIPAWSIAYDLAQWLILVQEQSMTGNRILPARGRVWPSPALLQTLNRRLACPEAEPLPRAPTQTKRLRLLLFLADAAHLCRDGALLPLAAAWLNEPTEQQTALLWKTWLEADPFMRQRYALADGLVAKPWPTPLLTALATLPHGATIGQIADHILDQPQFPAQYWTHQVDSLGDFNHLVTSAVSQVLIPFGILKPHRPGRGTATYHLTGLGEYLLGIDTEHQSLWHCGSTAGARMTSAADSWQLDVPATIPVRVQADLAAYADHAATSRRDATVIQHYSIDGSSLARAISAGHRWPAFEVALSHPDITVSDIGIQSLATFFARIPKLSLRTHTLLQTDRPESLRALLENLELRPLVNDLLSATTATLAVPPETATGHLQTHGYAVDGETSPNPSGQPDESGALWLAANIYRRLADFLPIPLPLMPSTADALLSAKSPVQRSALTVFYESIESALRDLLDGRIFAPPVFAGDVEAHRAHLEKAATESNPLYLDYFSPARNLLTRRPVTPLWLETLDDHLYLRAECLLSGRILLFRLDRIHAIWDTPPDDAITVDK